MIGKTNSQVGGGVKGEKLNISLTSNQSSHSDLIGTIITVTHPGGVTEYTWDGSEFTVEIPPYVEYSVEFGAINGYATPAKITSTSIADNAKTITGTYQTEVVSVTLNADNGESMNGQSVTINGKTSVWNGTPITQKVAFGTSYEVSVDEKKDYIAPSSVSYTASQARREVVMDYTYNPATDLSRVDIYGNPIMQNTANCYIIKEAGKYQFPIAYGAAVKNGEANPIAYTNNGGVYSHDFVNYLGNVITSPYVEVDTGKTVISVQMSISDTENAVTGLKVINNKGNKYVAFNVPSVPATGANAVISVKDADGVIMWSWHIWLWPHDLTPVEIINSTGVAYNIMPVNLATILDTAESINGTTGWKNWYYQFGRPNPMLCPKAYNSTSNHASYGALSYADASIASNIQTGIKNPTTFYNSSNYNYNWFLINSDKTYNLWDQACTSTGRSDNNVVKTVYDPCPPGFKMPNGNTFTGFGSGNTVNAVGSFINGYKFKRNSSDATDLFFPASGYRYYSSGSLYFVGSRGVVWSAAANSQSYAYYLYFYDGYVDPQSNSDRAHGFSVRPVAES